MLAAGIGNIHEIPWMMNWITIRYMRGLLQHVIYLMVLHGGSGNPQEQVEKQFPMGISKINVNTELQLAFRDATRKYIEVGKT